MVWRITASALVNRIVLLSGRATAPTVELCQRESGRCRLWCYAFDQDGAVSRTIAVFTEHDWEKVLAEARQTCWRAWRHAIGRRTLHAFVPY